MSIRREIKKYQIKPKRDQIFLVDENILNKEVKYAELSSKDTVLEIGCGIGNLTEKLVKHAGHVIAFEKDPTLASICRGRIGANNLEIINADVLKADLPSFNKIVSNIPYSISAPLTFNLLQRKFDVAVLIYQKEFAEKMKAEAGKWNYGRLSVSVQARARVELLDVVPRTCFYPRPAVDSRIIRLRPTEAHLPSNFDSVVRALFQHRRKVCKNALIDSAHETGIKEMRSIAPSICPDKKVFQMGLKDILDVCRKLEAYY